MLQFRLLIFISYGAVDLLGRCTPCLDPPLADMMNVCEDAQPGRQPPECLIYLMQAAMLASTLKWLGAAAESEVAGASGLVQLCMEQAGHADRGVREALAAGVACMARPSVLAVSHHPGSPQGAGKPDGVGLLQVWLESEAKHAALVGSLAQQQKCNLGRVLSGLLLLAQTNLPISRSSQGPKGPL